MLTNLPLAQLSYGPVLRHIGRLEEAQQITAPATAVLDFGFAGTGPEALLRPFAAPFASVSLASFLITALVVMMGVAAAPWLLPRCTTTLGVYEARKSLGWAIFFSGVLILTLSACAAFLRAVVMRDLVGNGADQLPDWFGELRAMGLAGLDGRVPELPLSSFLFARDGVLYAVPHALELPYVATHLTLAGAIAAGLAASAATAFALAAILAEDVFAGLKWKVESDAIRTNTARLTAAIVVVVGLTFSLAARLDPFELFLIAMALSAGSAFPVVVLSIWWKRLNTFGSIAGIVIGFAAVIILLFANNSVLTALPIPVAGLAGAAVSLVMSLVVSLTTPGPQRAALEAAREMRIPGGETVYDREVRLLQFAQRRRD